MYKCFLPSLRLPAYAIAITVTFCFSSLAQDIRIVSVDALNASTLGENSSGSVSIDVVQGSCGDEEDATLEPFDDTALRIAVLNPTSQIFSIKKFFYKIRNPYGSGGRLRSRSFAVVGNSEIAAGEDATTVHALFLDMQDANKSYAGHTTAIPSSLGFRTIKIFLKGRLANGQRKRIAAKITLSLDDFDRC